MGPARDSSEHVPESDLEVSRMRADGEEAPAGSRRLSWSQGDANRTSDVSALPSLDDASRQEPEVHGARRVRAERGADAGLVQGRQEAPVRRGRRGLPWRAEATRGRQVTPWVTADSLQPDEIFVFGSNYGGRHTRGAAELARRLGAKNGQGEGLMGRTYGIPTKPEDVRRRLTLSQIEAHVRTFVEFARQAQKLKFLVSAVGCGLAGYEPREVAPLFKEAAELRNVWLPASFWQVLAETSAADEIQV